MTIERTQSILVLGLLLIAAIYSLVQILVALKGEYVSGATDVVWALGFAIIVAFWTDNDAKIRAYDKPYEYSWFVFLL